MTYFLSKGEFFGSDHIYSKSDIARADI